MVAVSAGVGRAGGFMCTCTHYTVCSIRYRGSMISCCPPVFFHVATWLAFLEDVSRFLSPSKCDIPIPMPDTPQELHPPGNAVWRYRISEFSPPVPFSFSFPSFVWRTPPPNREMNLCLYWRRCGGSAMVRAWLLSAERPVTLPVDDGTLTATMSLKYYP